MGVVLLGVALLEATSDRFSTSDSVLEVSASSSSDSCPLSMELQQLLCRLVLLAALPSSTSVPPPLLDSMSRLASVQSDELLCEEQVTGNELVRRYSGDGDGEDDKSGEQLPTLAESASELCSSDRDLHFLCLRSSSLCLLRCCLNASPLKGWQAIQVHVNPHTYPCHFMPMPLNARATICTCHYIRTLFRLKFSHTASIT